MELVHSDKVFTLEGKPDYANQNPLDKLQQILSKVTLAAGADVYVTDSIQYLIPYEHLEFYGPQGKDWRETDPARQNNKRDMQKQSLRDFQHGPISLVRGFAKVNDRLEPFLQLAYDACPNSILAREAADRGLELGEELNAWVEVGREDASFNGGILRVPFDKETNTYRVELWGFNGSDLAQHLDERGKASLANGFLQNRPDLILSFGDAFDARPRVDMRDINYEHTMHPLLPLTVFVAWSDNKQRIWDSRGGLNYRFQFEMKLRGRAAWLKSGAVPFPYGGRGDLNYRTLFSNYGLFEESAELSRDIEPWNADSFGDVGGGSEPFMAVNYMDLQSLGKGAAIGLHRHRDNQEAILMTRGRGLMVVGDWAKFPERERCFEIRTLCAGSLVLIKGGHLHGLINHGDEDVDLFVFGGHD